MGKKGTLFFVIFGICDSIYGVIYHDKISIFAGIIVAIGAVWIYYRKKMTELFGDNGRDKITGSPAWKCKILGRRLIH